MEIFSNTPTEENMGGKLCYWGLCLQDLNQPMMNSNVSPRPPRRIRSEFIITYNNEVTSTSKETPQADGENKWQLDLSLMGLQMLSG